MRNEFGSDQWQVCFRAATFCRVWALTAHFEGSDRLTGDLYRSEKGVVVADYGLFSAAMNT